MSDTETKQENRPEVAPAENVHGANMLTKMSVKTIKCKPKMAAADLDNKQLWIARFTGIARGIKEAIGNDGDTVYGLTGNFKGRNIETGDEFTSGVLYLPSGIQESYLEQLDTLLQKDKNSSLILGLDVYAEPSASKAGYGYSARQLIQGEADPFAEVNALLSAAKDIPALPAPKPAKAK